MWEKIIAIGTVILIVLTSVLIWLGFNRPAVNWPMLGTVFIVVLGLGIAAIFNYKTAKLRSAKSDTKTGETAAEKHTPEVTLLATSLVYESNNPAISYPLKMNIDMRNDSSECIDVQLQGYKPGIGELKKFLTAVLRINFSGKPFPPVDGQSRIAVLRGQQFHAWLGFDEKKITKEQLERHRGKIGTLTLIVNGQTVDLPL